MRYDYGVLKSSQYLFPGWEKSNGSPFAWISWEWNAFSYRVASQNPCEESLDTHAVAAVR